MNNLFLSPKSLISSNAFPSLLSPLPSSNPNPIFPLFQSISSKTLRNSVVNCRGIEVSVLNDHSNSLSSSSNGSTGHAKLKNVGVKDVDIATFGNLCVDIVLGVPQLPPEPLSEREAYMEDLASSPPDKVYIFIFFVETQNFYLLWVPFLISI